MNAIAFFVGKTAALMADPLLFAAAAVAGVAGRKLRSFALLFALAGPATHLVISYIVWSGQFRFGEARSLYEIIFDTAAARLLGFLIVMAIARGLVALFRSK